MITARHYGEEGWVPDDGGGTVAPTDHAATHVTGGGDIIANAVAAGNAGLLSGADKTKLDALGTAAAKNIPATGNASATEVVYGSDTRLADARTPASHAHSSHSGIGANDHHAQAHVLNAADHTVSGLTPGQVLKALTPTTFGFAEDGPFDETVRTNLCTNPSFELDTNADGVADGWQDAASEVTGTVVYSLVAGRTAGTLAQRIQYTGVAGDSAGNKRILISLAAASWPVAASGETWTISGHFKQALAGCTNAMRLIGRKVNGDYVEESSAAITDGASFTRFSVTRTFASANVLRCDLLLTVSNIGTGDTVDITIDDILIEKTSSLKPYFDGSYANCAWDGTANASTSRQHSVYVPTNGNVGFYGTAPVARQTVLTEQLACSYPASETADYSVTITSASPWGFSTYDEACGYFSYVASLENRVNELEDKLQAYGLLDTS